ncbi:MAG: hypothetical protein ACO3CV_03100 [Steroidobacteraceae bacterium]
MKTLYTLAFVAALAAGPVHAACTYPKAPEKIPNGMTADITQMKAAQAEVKRFNDEITAYQSCLKSEHEAALAANPDLTEEQRKEREQIYASKNDAAFEAVSAIVAQWSEQRAAYLKKQEEAKKTGQ